MQKAQLHSSCHTPGFSRTCVARTWHHQDAPGIYRELHMQPSSLKLNFNKLALTRSDAAKPKHLHPQPGHNRQGCCCRYSFRLDTSVGGGVVKAGWFLPEQILEYIILCKSLFVTGGWSPDSANSSPGPMLGQALPRLGLRRFTCSQ